MYKSKFDLTKEKAGLYHLYVKYNKGLNKIFKRKIIKKYKTVEKRGQINNHKYINDNLTVYKNLFDNINNYSLDEFQREIVLSEEDNTLVVAGAGSGKSLTILGRILYLINRGVNPSNILCISFTNVASNSLIESLIKNGIDLDVITFHKLGVRILKDNNISTNLTKTDTLNNIVEKKVNEDNDLIKLLPDLNFFEIGDELEDLKREIIIHGEDIKSLKKLFVTFINLFKGSNKTINDFDLFIDNNEKEKDKYLKEKNGIFLSLSKSIYEEYTYILNKNKEIDFHDMINKATEIVKKRGVKNYEYIIIDEYQDTSLVKCELIQAIKEYTGAKLLVVGDDWQSIYKFTGCDLSLFTNFDYYFPYSKTFKLENTYRNSSQLLEVTSKFILKNKNQISKNLKSNKVNLKPIYIYYYDSSINEVIDKVISDIPSTDVLLLGRNNKDLENIKINNKKVTYMTVHKSKGLEAENVIIINLEDRVTGFPNKIISEDVLKYVTAINEDFPFEEERRLFYVALTRTKNNNYLLVNKNRPSLFVSELLKDSSKYIKVMTDILKCPRCGKNLIIKKSQYGFFYGCQLYPECKYTKNIEQSCRKNPNALMK